MPADLDIDKLLADEDKRVIVCCGAGGVGKTTTAASLALRAAELHGRHAVVLTIDPARRLAQSLGMEQLENAPRAVAGVRSGQLDAMMLDMKRTFDEMVEAHSTPERAQEIFANPFYQAMSSTFSGTQEYMAMEKLAQLRNAEQWDLIVVDTPPSRSALDFLDAPARLSRFLDGRMARLLTAPGSSRPSLLSFMGSAAHIFTRAFHKILGGHLLTDVAQFAKSLESTLGGFRQRAEATFRTLQDPQTSFLVVAAPEPGAMREAMYFTRRLTEERMPLEGLILNRTTAPVAESVSAVRAAGGAARLSEEDGDEAVAAVLRLHADLMQAQRAEQRLAARYTAACPSVSQLWLPRMARDVYDLDALREFGQLAAD
ncbi:ArsA family ATPase [Natronoglycomyces albus]|uniref:ArsA family ATPase n=1 Tax=Natronoglycomyces albus TaxID=2811108 RepID=A0A895XSQ6_9ACTN|nr:ArsA-related P-loop ATPase [Natronoglycomyces albus]QSB05576.1 ArsA family ATPase [Natronoglycomyces albus]